MASITSRLRTRLDTLWKAICDEKIDTNQVSDDFLSACKVRLVQHHFEAKDDDSNDESTYLSYNPPILLVPCPQSAVDDHPFDLAQCIHPLTGDSKLKFRDYKSPSQDNGLSSGNSPGLHTKYLSWYLENWAIHGFPRQNLPPLVWGLSGLSYIVPIRFPNEIDSKPGISGDRLGKHWRARVYEYFKDNDRTYSPHIIMLSTQSASGQDGNILYGELVQLITAMRNRAHQHAMIQDGEEYEEPKPRNPPEFYFKHEQRFPVLMISCVAPQHARIYYACMDGSEVIIRQSLLFSFEKDQEAHCDYFARFLASRRLEEDNGEKEEEEEEID